MHRWTRLALVPILALLAGSCGKSSGVTGADVPEEIRKANELLQGTWYRDDGAIERDFLDVIRFTKTGPASGVYEDRYKTLYYGFTEGGTGIILSDANDNLVITYGFELTDAMLVLSFWNREREYFRAPQIPPASFQVSMSALDRVPIYNAGQPNARAATVTVSPSPLPAGQWIVLSFRNPYGSGWATLPGGARQLIDRTTTIEVRGASNSGVRDDVELVAEFAGAIAASEPFTVRTWPVGFAMSPEPVDPAGDGILRFTVRWQSESGNLADLYGNDVGEWVDYPGDGPQFCPPSPPWANGCVPDPTVKSVSLPAPTPDGFVHDQHKYDSYWPPVKPYIADVFIATQYYTFRDPVLMGSPANVLGPYYIRRNVYQDAGGAWKYRVEKAGRSDEIALP